MSKWKRFKNWLIRKLGGYTEEQTRVVEKVVEKPMETIEFTYCKAEPVCIKSRIVLSQFEIKNYLDYKSFIQEIKSKVSHQIAEQIADNECFEYSITYDYPTDRAIIEFETKVLLASPIERKQSLQELLSAYER